MKHALAVMVVGGAIQTFAFAAIALPAARKDFAVIATDDRDACVALPTAERPGTRLAVIVPQAPQRVVRATLGRRLSAACKALANADVPGEYHAVSFSEGALEPGEVGIAVLGKLQLSVRHGTVLAAEDATSPPLHFRSCTSHEGIHLTVWRGKPLSGTRMWHSYVHLLYDGVPTCSEQEYRE